MWLVRTEINIAETGRVVADCIQGGKNILHSDASHLILQPWGSPLAQISPGLGYGIFILPGPTLFGVSSPRDLSRDLGL